MNYDCIKIINYFPKHVLTIILKSILEDSNYNIESIKTIDDSDVAENIDENMYYNIEKFDEEWSIY